MSQKLWQNWYLQLSFESIFFILGAVSNELTRCCAGGTRHFKTSNTCSSIKAEGSSMTCQRTASICCLRSLLDQACDSGTDIARQEESCPSNINVLGGGLKKVLEKTVALFESLTLGSWQFLETEKKGKRIELSNSVDTQTFQNRDDFRNAVTAACSPRTCWAAMSRVLLQSDSMPDAWEVSTSAVTETLRSRMRQRL